jgi:hypothetical protein
MKHKIAAINFLLLGLIGFTVATVAIGYIQIRHNIFGAFPTSNFKKQSAADIQRLLAESKALDTDKDGLSDSDEQNIYKTSAYIADTDSDGFSDGEEVKAGSNSLDQESTPMNKKAAGAGLERVFKVTNPQQEGTSAQRPTSQEIRDLLIQKGGLDKETVDKIDDEMLIKLYNETKKETAINPQELNQTGESVLPGSSANGLPAGETSDENSQILSSFQNMTPQEIRQLLVSNGMDEKELSQIDDETLKKIFLETISNNP